MRVYFATPSELRLFIKDASFEVLSRTCVSILDHGAELEVVFCANISFTHEELDASYGYDVDVRFGTTFA